MATYLVRRDLIALLESRRAPALALVQIDRFPESSDLYGRATGDHLMQQLAELVRGLARELVVERFYDDMFVIVLTEPDASKAERFAEAICTAIEGHGFDPGGLRLTASIGLAFRGPNILDDARGNLRRAKLLGGNRVVTFDGDATGQLRGHQVVPWPDETLWVPRPRDPSSEAGPEPPTAASSPTPTAKPADPALANAPPPDRARILTKRDFWGTLMWKQGRAHRRGRPLSLVMIGIDCFKRLDHEHGRGTGERTLRQLLELVRDRSRETDMVARFHDADLVVILPELDLRSATSFAATICEAVARHRFEPEGHRITVSLGVSECSPHHPVCGELLDMAESRLWRARSLGQNQVVSDDGPDCRIWRIRHITSPPSACLLAIRGSERGRKYDIEDRELTIGRAATSDIRVPDDSISRTHATITPDEDGVRIRDVESKHGIRLNGVQIGEAYLHDGDIIEMGSQSFKFLISTNIESSYHGEIHRLSAVDDLTQIFNRRYFTDTLERELSRARRYDRPLALMMLDIDCFKRCNDTFGHRAGDHVLQQLANIVRDRSRKADVVARYGGEELAVILPEIDLQGAAKLGGAIREEVEQTPFVFEGQHIPLTVSVAVAELEPHIANSDDLVRVTEARMARAKALGRNRVVSSDEQAEAAENEPPGWPPTLA